MNLVEVLRTRERNTDDADKRKALMGRAAKTLETLGEVDEAILAYRAVLDDFGADRKILGALAVLYEKAGFKNKAIEMWERCVGSAPDDETRESIKTHLLRLL